MEQGHLYHRQYIKRQLAEIGFPITLESRGGTSLIPNES